MLTVWSWKASKKGQIWRLLPRYRDDKRKIKNSTIKNTIRLENCTCLLLGIRRLNVLEHMWIKRRFREENKTDMHLLVGTKYFFPKSEAKRLSTRANKLMYVSLCWKWPHFTNHREIALNYSVSTLTRLFFARASTFYTG